MVRGALAVIPMGRSTNPVYPDGGGQSLNGVKKTVIQDVSRACNFGAGFALRKRSCAVDSVTAALAGIGLPRWCRAEHRRVALCLSALAALTRPTTVLLGLPGLVAGAG
jgi:hypothetical protein